MTNSLNEIVYATLSSIAGESRITEDLNLDTELLEYTAVSNRAFLIRSDQSKGRSLSDNVIQTLYCVPIQSISISECPCLVPSTCTIVRSVQQIPRFIELYQKDLCTKVSGSSVSTKGFSIVSFARASVSGTSKYTKGTPKAFFHNQYLYILNPPESTQTVTISGVFEDPRQAGNFANCSGVPCYNNDDTFPISMYMVPALKQLILKDLGLLIQQQTDDLGDEHYVKGQPPTQEGSQGKA